jgi:D-glycero-D-manno-heptose 1,7-bisphosphate phosphatase
MQKAVFFDRDGVINYDPGVYTTSLGTFDILPGVINQMKRLHDAGFSLFVITNQGGIAKGLYTENEVCAMHDFLQGLCILHGFRITEFYFCPHHPDYSRCLCRKPGSLMLERAIAMYRIDAGSSFMIGDKERDMEAAAGAGVQGLLMESNQRVEPLVSAILRSGK